MIRANVFYGIKECSPFSVLETFLAYTKFNLTVNSKLKLIIKHCVKVTTIIYFTFCRGMMRWWQCRTEPAESFKCSRSLWNWRVNNSLSRYKQEQWHYRLCTIISFQYSTWKTVLRCCSTTGKIKYSRTLPNILLLIQL